MENEIIDIKKADNMYKPFPTFEKWCECTVNKDRWEIYRSKIKSIKSKSNSVLKKARMIVSRAAAIETGAIEKLYEVDRGFTITGAIQTAAWAEILSAKGNNTRSLIESQLSAYEYVLDFATKKTEILGTWIRQLHSILCKSQETYSVQTSTGPQQQALPLGKYKIHPNHVIQQDNKIHAYAPVDITAAEMNRMCKELNSEKFINAHPILQASFAHYSFVCIHPFADGNGRVARALGSVFTYRSDSIPLLILSDIRQLYFDTLAEADNNNYQYFVDFILARAIDAIDLLSESIKSAEEKEIPDVVDSFKKLYKTSGGYTHLEIDNAGERLFKLLHSRLFEASNKYNEFKELSINYMIKVGKYKLVRSNTRFPRLNEGQILRITIHTSEPAASSTRFSMAVEVPKDSGIDDDLIISKVNGEELFSARLTELIPKESAALILRLDMFASRILSKLLFSLFDRAKKSLNDKGY